MTYIARSLVELLRLKEIFGASCEAITYRCKDLGIIGQPLYDELFGVFKEKGWRAKPYEETGAMSPAKESPRRLERLCYRALAEGAVSDAKAAELLGISARELNRRLDEPERAGVSC